MKGRKMPHGTIGYVIDLRPSVGAVVHVLETGQTFQTDPFNLRPVPGPTMTPDLEAALLAARWRWETR